MNQLLRTLSKTLITGLLTLIISLNVCLGQTKNEQFDELLNLYHEFGKFNGSVLIADQGKIIYKKGFGLANMEWDIPNMPETKHRLGSITKQFTAMLILQLAAEDKIDLHAPISKYLPNYPKTTADKITTHHLLIHSSGIPNYTSFPEFSDELSRDHYSPDEFIEKFQDMNLEFNPGEKFNYSNSGYFLLGLIIEKLSGKTYEELLHEKIFQPLGMENSGYDNNGDILKNRAAGYEKNGNQFVNADYLDMSLPYAAGSMYSTVEDLYKWDQALYTTNLLPQKYMDLFFKPYIPAFGDFQYAYGWGVGNESIGNTADQTAVVSHGGGINGFNTIISRSKSDKSLVVLLNNTGGAPLNEMTQAIRGIMKGKTYDLPKKSLAFELLDIVLNDGMEAGLKYFEASKDSEDLDFSENEMNQIGYQLMGDDHLEEAAKIFELNKEAFPKSFNVFDSYAEALMNLGKKEEAIKNYKISIEMNPANQNGIDMLKKLGENTNDLVKEVIVPEATLMSYLGDYELMPNFILSITYDGNQLRAQGSGQPMVQLHAKSKEVFYIKEVAAQITFNKSENGKIENLTLLQGGQTLIGKRLAK